MELPIGVLGIYAALAIWVGLMISGLMKGRYLPFILFGIALMLFLNVRYLIEGAPASIAFFIGIYDLLINLGLTEGETPAAMSTCVGNACTVWGDRFMAHPAWGTAFYERFSTGPELRTNLLYGHIVFNSLAFVLMHVQMFRPGGQARAHPMLGRVTFLFLTISVICAVWLSSEHGPVGEYGGSWSMWGFYSMSAFVYGTAIVGVIKARRGDLESHRVWMWRFAGSMWGSFWLFRVMLFVLDPILRDQPSAAILICIWGSAPAGILIAEFIRRRLDQAGANRMVAAE